MKTVYDVFVLSCLIFCFHTCHCNNSTTPKLTRTFNHNLAYGQFALELLVETSCLLDSKHNVVLSPFSIWSVLMPTMEGASGKTLNQLKGALHLSGNKQSMQTVFRKLQKTFEANTSSSVELSSVNSVFTDINRPIRKEFEQKVEDVYKSQIFPINFHDVKSALQDINSWVSKATHNRITELVREDDLKDPNLILANGIYFKGQWKYPFNTSDTIDDNFFDENGKILGQVKMMIQSGPFMYAIVPEIESRVLVLPYQGDEFSMVLVLPQASTPVLQVLERIKLLSFAQVYKQVAQAQDVELDEVTVCLPRFVIKSDFLLNSALQNLGIKDAFTKKADFHLISSNNLYLSKVIHKAEIEVTEEGTTATAVTGGIYVNKMMPAVFKANRPFAYFIIQKEHQDILFAGQVSNAVQP